MLHVVCLLALTVTAAQEAEPAAPTADEIARAITDLGAPKFDARQAATDLLWRAGTTAEAALAQAAKSTDPEVRTRATSLLSRLRLGIRPDTPQEVIALIDQFRYAATADQRRQALNELQSKGHWQAVLTLIRGEQNPQERRNLATAMAAEAGKLAGALVERGELAQAEEILELVAVTDAGLPQLTAFLILTDRLDKKIAVARQRTAEQPSDEHWTRLAYLLRAKGDLSAAIEAAEHTSDLVLRTNLLAEARRWKEAAGYAQTLFDRNPGRLESAAFAATYYRLAGLDDEHQRALDLMLRSAGVEWLKSQGQGVKQADPFGQAVPTPIVQTTLWTAAESMLVNERVDDAIAILQKTNPQFAHRILWRQQRHRQALELAGVTSDARLDRAWFDKLLLPMASGQWSAVSDTTAQQELKFVLASQVARQLRELGLREQLDQLGETLRKLEPTQNDRGRRLAQLATLWWQLGRPDDAARDAAAAIAAGMNPSSVFSFLLRQQGTLATFWYEQQIAADPNFDKQKAIDKALGIVVPEPRRGKAPENWRQLVATAQAEAEKLPRQQKAQRLNLIGQTCQIRGDKELARDCFSQAAQTEPALGIAAGDLALSESNWPLAAKLYSAARSATSTPLLIYLYGHALTKSGAADAGEKQLRLANLLALAPESRLILAAGLNERGLKDEAIEQLELVARTALPDSPQAIQAVQTMANALNMAQPAKAADCWDQLRLHVLNASNFNENDAYLFVPHRIHAARAKVAIRNQDANEAAAELERCDKLLPADVRITVEFVRQLNAAGLPKVADDLFARSYAVHQRVITEFPASAMHINNTAWICARAQRNLDEALKLAEKAVEIAPEEAPYRDTLAEVYFQRGDRDAAVAAAQKCVEIAPDYKLYATRLAHFQNDDLKTLDGDEPE
jgi:tetratricopeptide (TPR) repeat protein